jgi:hypothetical protein
MKISKARIPCDYLIADNAVHYGRTPNFLYCVVCGMTTGSFTDFLIHAGLLPELSDANAWQECRIGLELEIRWWQDLSTIQSGRDERLKYAREQLRKLNENS